MKKLFFALVTGLLLILFIPKARAVDVTGILETGDATVSIQQVTWYLTMMPQPIEEFTRDWGGPPGTVDTFVFQPKMMWPDSALLNYLLNNTPHQLMINSLQPDSWYELPGLDFQGPRVCFQDTAPHGIQAPPNNNRFTGLTIFPNPVREGLVRLEPTFAQVELYDIIGNRCPIHLTRDQYGVTVDISKLDCGIYLLRIRNRGFESTTKILKLQ